MFLSIIIPVYNRAHLIANALDSVIQQRDDDCEIIVIDDGSTDTTPQTLKRYNGQIRVVRTENQGAGLARNTGIQLAKGKYVAFLDSDDVWFPWTVKNLKQIIAQTGRPSVIQTTFVWLQAEGKLPADAPADVQYQVFEDVFSYGMCHAMSGAGATIVKSEALRKCGGFSNQRIVGEDIDLLFKLGTEKGCVLLSNPPSFAYCRHDEMTTLSADAWYKGALFLLQQERKGLYPGGKLRQCERRHCLAMDAAYRSLVCLKAGNVMNALRIYLASLTWQIQSAHFDYLFKTPVRMLLALIDLWPSVPIRQKKLNER
jgi:cellulose synthase/poly-beta-1,6-N-acetylglucosamine synthase-like glycosyltransferase